MYYCRLSLLSADMVLIEEGLWTYEKEGSFMKIILVTDEYGSLNNGTTMTAHRFYQMLRERGHDVHMLASGELTEPDYRARAGQYPIATKVAAKQGFGFAVPDEALFRRAFRGADVVHFLLPLPFEKKAMKICREMGVPMSAAFHLQPENITYICHMPRETLANGIYTYFRHSFYKYFDHIHCPSEFIANQLIKHGYKAKMHVISNGVDDDFTPAQKPQKRKDGKIHILMVGRLSPEKRQKVLIEAVRGSKYAGKIQLHLAGKGPCMEALVKQGEKLTNPPEFGFYSKEELIGLIRSCDLYVHASYIEIEAISCMEAFACGLVPVICNSPKSATTQFALCEESLFAPDDPDDLARKIEYWIENPERKAVMSVKYAQQGEKYRVSRSVEEAERMFLETIRDYKRRHHG